MQKVGTFLAMGLFGVIAGCGTYRYIDPSLTSDTEWKRLTPAPAAASIKPAPVTDTTQHGSPDPDGNSKQLIAAEPQPTAWALIVGLERYRDIPSAAGARNDAERIAALMRRTLGLREDRIRLLVEDHATRGDIMRGLAWLKTNVGPGNRVYFYFGGHGLPGTDQSAYLAAYDADMKDLMATSVGLSEIMKSLSETKAREVIAFVDACFSGAGGRSVHSPGRPVVPIKQHAPPQRVVLLTASQKDEVSNQAPDENAGLFSKYLVEALGTGQADRNLDGQVTVDELQDWVRVRVTNANRKQTPGVLYGNGANDGKDMVVEFGVPPH